MFQLTPKRPLRSEVEREKRLSRTQSQIAATGKIDNASVSGESSNSRNSISKFFCSHRIINCYNLFISSYNRLTDLGRRSATAASQNIP